MSLYGSFALDQNFAELLLPLETQGAGVMSASDRRKLARANLQGDGAGSTTDASIMGVGTAAGPFSLGTAAQNAVDYELTSSSTTGPVRGIYVSLTQTAAANTGSAIKGILTVANVATGVSNGVHAELSITGASGSITSTAAPLKSTVTVAAASTTPGGTLGVATLESNIDTAVTVPTTWYFIRCINSGAKPIGYFAEIPTASNGTLFAAHVTDAMSHSIRIKSAAGTTYYIMCTATATNRS